MRSRRRAAAALLAVTAALAGGCAALRPAGPPPAVEEAFRGGWGRNPGLEALRAVTEARFRYAGREVSLPGVLTLDTLVGFRLELLDPLDRPLALFYAEEGRLVQYRPAQRLGASLGVFRADCRSVNPADWVTAVLGSTVAPVAGERVRVRSLWRGGYSLERYRAGALYASARLSSEGGALSPWLFSWYCGEEAVMRLRLGDWVEAGGYRLPTRLELEYPATSLAVTLELREIEGNPPPTGRPLLPRPGDDTRWTTWRLPQ